MTRTMWAATALLACAAGCGPSQGPDADPNEATTALSAALDSWVKGDAPESLQRRSPPIWFNEPERAKSKLLNYQLVGEPGMYGRQVRRVARLKLEGGGRAVEREIPYLIDTTPNRVITREGY